MDTASQRDRLAETRAALHKWKARADSARRQILSPALLGPLLHERHRTFQARHASSPYDDERFLQMSPAYRNALVDRERLSERLSRDAAKAVIDGFQWWSPLPPLAKRDEEAASEAGFPRFPYRGILQTRELAIGGVMLDIGAHTGMMSIPRVVLGDVTMAYCCEPDPLTYACLVANVADNGLRGAVLPDRTAVGDRDGFVHLRRVGASGGFHVVPGAGADTIEVPCTTLDSWLDRLSIDLDAVTFIKVDVEGFEQRLLSGAPRTLTHRHIVWQIEVKPSYLRAIGDSLASLCDMARSAFSYFIDLNPDAAGSRVRPIDELAAGLAYVDQKGKTDVLVFNEMGSGVIS